MHMWFKPCCKVGLRLILKTVTRRPNITHKSSKRRLGEPFEAIRGHAISKGVILFAYLTRRAGYPGVPHSEFCPQKGFNTSPNHRLTKKQYGKHIRKTYQKYSETHEKIGLGGSKIMKNEVREPTWRRFVPERLRNHEK